MSEEQAPQQEAPEAAEQPTERTFTQAELDRIVQERLAADRRSRDLTPEQVNDLKSRVEAAEKSIAEAQEARKAAERDALVARLQRAHGITDEDAATFLTASTQEELARQAERLGALAKPAEKPDFGNPKVGGNPEPPIDEDREFVRSLTNRSGS